MSKNLINDSAFTDELTELDNTDTILVRQTSKSKKNTEITKENLLIDLSTSFVVPRTYKTADYTVTDSDRKIECLGTFPVTLPLLSTITHYDDIVITNVSTTTGEITINTSGGELLVDATSFVLYASESLTINKGQTKYIAI